jgi:hypothetical protein
VDEQDWQPVRIASTEQILARSPGHNVADTPARAIGKIIRVRPLSTSPPCDAGRYFEVHPDDWEILGPPAWASQVCICEYQILAD